MKLMNIVIKSVFNYFQIKFAHRPKKNIKINLSVSLCSCYHSQRLKVTSIICFPTISLCHSILIKSKIFFYRKSLTPLPTRGRPPFEFLFFLTKYNYIFFVLEFVRLEYKLHFHMITNNIPLFLIFYFIFNITTNVLL